MSETNTQDNEVKRAGAHELIGKVGAILSAIANRTGKVTPAMVEARGLIINYWASKLPKYGRWLYRPHDQGEGSPGFFVCHCGSAWEQHGTHGADFHCNACGQEFNFGGQALADRSQWGEETGESPAEVAAAFGHVAPDGPDLASLEAFRSDIGGMVAPEFGDDWFGPFEGVRIDDSGAYVEWPNLALLLAKGGVR
jgi:hypothetical protein